MKKQRHHFANKGLSSQSYGFSISHVQMWKLDHRESWVLKNSCFQTVVLEKTLESLLDSKKIKSVNPKEINFAYSLEGVMLKLKFQYFGYLMERADSLEKTRMLGKIEGRRRKGKQRMRCLDSITDSVNMNLSKLWDIEKDRETWCAAVHRVAKRWTWLSDWTMNNSNKSPIFTHTKVFFSKKGWKGIWLMLEVCPGMDWIPYMKVKVAQSCPTLWDPIDYLVHGILLAGILEWGAIPFSGGSS